jgi:SAM-dependent methyltransferase
MSVSTFPGVPSYAFDNDDLEARDRHTYLSEILDEVTIERLASLGDLTGKRCLEVGAGGGSVAAWLAARTGRTGHVLATDINPRHLPVAADYSVLGHDLVNEPIPDGPWDVIHARLVLLHIPEREDILRRMADALAPGGALLVEEWEATFGKLLLSAPDEEAASLFDEYLRLMLGQIMPAKGNDAGWASRVHAAMMAAGLTNVDTRVSSRSWPGGTAGALLVAANIGQLREEFIEAGMSAQRLDRLCELVADPRLVVRNHFTYSTLGRRPLADT